jgi:hypothetical protein
MEEESARIRLHGPHNTQLLPFRLSVGPSKSMGLATSHMTPKLSPRPAMPNQAVSLQPFRFAMSTDRVAIFFDKHSFNVILIYV